MSLYNMIHGTNPIAPLLLHMLGNPDIPRFRDCYLDGDRIAIYTRTGGGNRAAYELGGRDQKEWNPDGPFNDDLRKIPEFIKDLDDDFDCTYATFYFAIPADFVKMVHTLREIGAGREEKPADAWKRVLDDLQSGKETTETRRAIDGMRPILDDISKSFESGGAQ